MHSGQIPIMPLFVVRIKFHISTCLFKTKQNKKSLKFPSSHNTPEIIQGLFKNSPVTLENVCHILFVCVSKHLVHLLRNGYTDLL